ncbi:MAG: hypothetical protein QXP70_03080 [Methanomassiliicoccales archaeon]
MQVSITQLKAVELALQLFRKGEPFERALGRATRRQHLNFDDYINTISVLREIAGRHKVSYVEAAKLLLQEYKQNE